MSKDYYDILGVDRDADKDTIKKSYRKLSKEYHPDKNSDPGAEDKFKEISEAYETLSNDEKRVSYDRFGGSGGGQFGGGGFEDFFSSFGGGFDMNDVFGSFTNRRGRNQGSDLRIRVSVNLKDIMTGVDKKLKYQRDIECVVCHGSGGKNVNTCRGCQGTGQKIYTQNTPIGVIRQASVCKECNGEGKTILDKCKMCRGSGCTKKHETVDVDLPRGCVGGMTMKIPLYGNFRRGGGYGDLLVVVDEIPDSKFKRNGPDIHCDETISVVDAILGCERTIKMPQGDEIKFDVSPGTSHGQTLRMRGRGIPDLNHNNSGSLLVNININIPKNLTDKEKEIVGKLKQLDKFK